MNYLILIVALLYNCQYLIKTQVDYACSPRWCPAYGNCPKFSCKGKDLKTIYNATKCGCCHKCVKELEENEECQPEMTGNIPGTQCGPHLKCDVNKEEGKSYCKKISEIKTEANGCEKKKLDLSLKMSQITTGEPIPECDEFGEYAAKQCKNGTLCHCVDKSGKRIFGSSTIANSKDMDCLCSRQFNEVNRQLSELDYSIDPVFYLRCKANGNYEPFQSVGNLTYCVNTTSGELLERPVHKRDVEQLSCGNRRYSYMSDCAERYINVTGEIKKLEEEGHIVVGYDVPKCDIDGTFAPVQCLNSHCYCVNKKGDKYRGTKVDRNDQFFAMNQNCNCVRELELIRDLTGKERDKVTDLFSHYKCDKNGNYLPLQCSESVCYCVDAITGYQNSKSILKTDGDGIKNLDCFNPHNYPDINRLQKIYENEF